MLAGHRLGVGAGRERTWSRPGSVGGLSAEHLLRRSVLRGGALHEPGRLTCGLALGGGESVDVALALEDVEAQADELGDALRAGERRPPAERDRVADDAGVVDRDRDERATAAVAVAADADAHGACGPQRARISRE